jgi:Family of unknown function (DUF6069)
VIRNWLIGLVIAVVAAVIVFFVATAAGVDLTVTPPGQKLTEIQVPFVVGAAVIGGIGALVVAVLIRLTPRPRITYAVIGVVVLLLSLGSPISAAENTGAAVTLVIMHIVVGLPLLWFVTRALPERKAAAVRA